MKQACLLLMASPEACGSLSLGWKLRGIVCCWDRPTPTADCFPSTPDCPSKAFTRPTVCVWLGNAPHP